MKRLSNLTVLFALAGLIGGCPGSVQEEPGPDPEKAAEARRTIVRWLECEECEEGELEAVVALGATAVPTLAATLAGGPSPASREIYRRELVARHAELVAYAETHPEAAIDMGVEAYVRSYLDNWEATYQVRSAQALAAIGGPEARRGLEEALGRELRGDVKAAIGASLEGMAGS